MKVTLSTFFADIRFLQGGADHRKGPRPGLHLNDDGNDILFSNFVNFINMYWEKACVDNATIAQITLDTSNFSIENVDKIVSENNVDKQDSDNAYTSLRLGRAKNKDRSTIGSLNMNSLLNKIDYLRTLVTDSINT